jgi:3' terminal RNA ribose 2'-O-methyltransferase Hen1
MPIVLLTLTTTGKPATDLGYLLHKHPARLQSLQVPAGTAYVFYPEASEDRCTAALLLEVDPVALVRGREGAHGNAARGEAFALGQYVNDRPYAASSMLAMALKAMFRTAFTGRCDARPDLAAARMPLEIRVPALRCRGGAALVRRVFEPLGWRVEASAALLDPAFPSWGESPYVDVRLVGEIRLADALNQLYVLLPALDDAKHYWVTADEVDKLIRAGSGWLAGHPEQALISRRYLAHQWSLTRAALARLADVDDIDPEEIDNAVPPEETTPAGPEPARPEPTGTGPTGAQGSGAEPGPALPLREQRRGAVLAVLRAAGARRVGDFGCGDGTLVRDLLADRAIEQVVAVDVSVRALQFAARRLRLDGMSEQQRQRVQLFQSALTYRDDRLAGLDAAVLMEVIEHVDPPRLTALERAVFGYAAPATVVVTTPNAEHNARYVGLADGGMRHRDHRFEWTRAEFRDWASRVASSFGYHVRFLPVGADDPEVGSSTQLAVFSREAA